MAFKEVADLSCENAIALGGVNKKTGKPNPKQIEGYFIGSRKVDDRKKASGFSYIHVFQTAKGNLGVWGKTDLDRKLEGIAPGTMVRATHTGMMATANGDMYKYKVETDSGNTIEVDAAPEAAATTEEGYDGDGEESPLDADESEEQALPTVRAQAPRTPAAPPNAAQQARVQALLKAGKSKTA
jgi:hypothetical protein